MTAKKTNKALRAKVIKLVDKGLTATQIGELVGRSRQRVHQLELELGVHVPQVDRLIARREQVRKMTLDGMTALAIADKLDVSRSCVTYDQAKLGVSGIRARKKTKS